MKNLAVVLIVVAYLLMAGVTARLAHRVDHQCGKSTGFRGDYVFAGIIWPMALPVIAITLATPCGEEAP